MVGCIRIFLTINFTLGISTYAIDRKELPPPAKHEINFKREIWPLLKKHCVKCHGPDQQKSGYRIDNKELAFEGGEMGEAIIPGNSAESPLVHFISGLDEEIVMPPKDNPFNAKTVGLIRAWIDQGADWPDDIGEKRVNRMDHWAFKKIPPPSSQEKKTSTGEIIQKMEIERHEQAVTTEIEKIELARQKEVALAKMQRELEDAFTETFPDKTK